MNKLTRYTDEHIHQRLFESPDGDWVDAGDAIGLLADGRAREEALQQRLNAADQRIDDLTTKGQSEPVAWRYREMDGGKWWITDIPPDRWYFDTREYEVRPLYEQLMELNP